jgi:hypothetical protein
VHAHASHALERVGRRRLLVGTAGALAGTAFAASLSHPAVAQTQAQGLASRARPLPPPKPIPGGIQIPGGPLIHIFLPGPTNTTLPFSGLQLQGLNVEPSTITDFNGATALAYLVGSATGSDGKRYNLEADLRIFEGTYIAETGARREGTFALI